MATAMNTRPQGGLQGRIVEAITRVAALWTLPVAAAARYSVARCPDRPETVQVLYSALGALESAIVDDGGRLFFTSQTWDGLTRGALLRLDRPGAEPTTICDSIEAPGGLAFDQEGWLIVGYGNSPLNGLLGSIIRRAGLLRIHPDTGEKQTYATGLAMANGIARAADGTIFASGGRSGIDRVDPNGTVHPSWANIPSGNGLAIDPTGQYLYASQSFVPAAIQRIAINTPTNVATYAQPGPLGRAVVLDGIDIDALGRLYVAANFAGQIWRVDTDCTICTLADGLHFPTAVALGHGANGFCRGNLYAVTGGGDVVAVTLNAFSAEIEGASWPTQSKD